MPSLFGKSYIHLHMLCRSPGCNAAKQLWHAAASSLKKPCALLVSPARVDYTESARSAAMAGEGGVAPSRRLGLTEASVSGEGCIATRSTLAGRSLHAPSSKFGCLFSSVSSGTLILLDQNTMMGGISGTPPHLRAGFLFLIQFYHDLLFSNIGSYPVG